MAHFHIIVGSVMGTALALARNLEQTLTSKGHKSRVSEGFQAPPLIANEGEILLVCTSNTGMGDLPAIIAPLEQYLTLNQPSLEGLRFGLINLGDSSYPNFAQAGQTLDEAMSSCGAERIGDMLVIDAIYVEAPREAAEPWLEHWLTQLETK